MRASRIAAALSIIGSLTVAAYQPAHAAPVTPLSAVAKARDNGTVQVRYGWGGGWRGGWGGGGWGPRGWGFGAGALAAGAIIGAAAAAPYYGGGYGGGYYPYYDEPAGYGYGMADMAMADTTRVTPTSAPIRVPIITVLTIPIMDGSSARNACQQRAVAARLMPETRRAVICFKAFRS